MYKKIEIKIVIHKSCYDMLAKAFFYGNTEYHKDLEQKL